MPDRGANFLHGRPPIGMKTKKKTRLTANDGRGIRRGWAVGRATRRNVWRTPRKRWRPLMSIEGSDDDNNARAGPRTGQRRRGKRWSRAERRPISYVIWAGRGKYGGDGRRAEEGRVSPSRRNYNRVSNRLYLCRCPSRGAPRVPPHWRPTGHVRNPPLPLCGVRLRVVVIFRRHGGGRDPSKTAPRNAQ